MEISRTTSNLMKGCAILSIALHNFIHVKGYAECNENTFYSDRTSLFFDHLLNASPSIAGDLISFIGWIGVPVFIFMTGYGLTKKFSKIKTINAYNFLKYSWLKLFLLMFPAVLIFIINEIRTGSLSLVVNSIISLTLLNNFVCNIFPFNPGVYWYFGLTFELYCIFFLVRKFSINALLWVSILCLSFQFVTSPSLFPDEVLLEYMRHNFIGWMPCLCLGIIIAKSRTLEILNIKPLISALIILFLIICILLMNFNYYIWLFLPFVAVFLFYLLAILAEQWSVTRKIGSWLGRYSAFIFVTHPIARSVIKCCPINLSDFVSTIIFLLLTICMSYAYERFYRMVKPEYRVSLQKK